MTRFSTAALHHISQMQCSMLVRATYQSVDDDRHSNCQTLSELQSAVSPIQHSFMVIIIPPPQKEIDYVFTLVRLFVYL